MEKSEALFTTVSLSADLLRLQIRSLEVREKLLRKKKVEELGRGGRRKERERERQRRVSENQDILA